MQYSLLNIAPNPPPSLAPPVPPPPSHPMRRCPRPFSPIPITTPITTPIITIIVAIVAAACCNTLAAAFHVPASDGRVTIVASRNELCRFGCFWFWFWFLFRVLCFWFWVSAWADKFDAVRPTRAFAAARWMRGGGGRLHPVVAVAKCSCGLFRCFRLMTTRLLW